MAPRGGPLLQEELNVEELRSCLGIAGSPEQRAKCAAQVIRQRGKYRWVGLYDVGSSEIAVIAWDGPDAPTHPRFPITSGLNGAAVANGSPVIVQDVAADPRYLTTLGNTKSEMIVPLRTVDGRVIGTIDVESDRVGAFTEADRRFLEACAMVILPLWSSATGRSR